MSPDISLHVIYKMKDFIYMYKHTICFDLLRFFNLSVLLSCLLLFLFPIQMHSLSCLSLRDIEPFGVLLSGVVETISEIYIFYFLSQNKYLKKQHL
jgi:hypothetical protein